MLAHEPFGVAGVGGGQDIGAHGTDRLGVSMVDIDGCVPGDAGMPVLGVVPGEEALAERPGVGDGAEGVGEVGPVLQRAEVGLAVRVVIAGVRPRVGLGHARSASRNATGLLAMDEPLSAWMVNVSRSTCCLVMVSASSFSASIADSASAISQPTTYRL